MYKKPTKNTEYVCIKFSKMLNLFFKPQDIVVFMSKYPIFKGFDTRYSDFWCFTLFRTYVIIVVQ